MTWLKDKKKPHNYWTKERVFEESHKYTNKKDFENNAKGAFLKARSEEWLAEMTWLKPLPLGPISTWTREAIIEESKKYTSRTEFAQNSPTAYQHACEDKTIFNEMPWIKEKKKPDGYWKVKEHVIEEGKKLKDIPFDLIYSSPLKRAFTTASLIKGERNIKIITDERLTELCFGEQEGIDICMKETMMLVIQHLVKKEEGEKASFYLKTPTDILRYLWYEKTSQLQIIQPSVLLANARRLGYQMGIASDTSLTYQERMKEHLKLKYSRKTCKMVAMWMNATVLPAKKAGEDMNPKSWMIILI